jgi:hypothetical protein
MSGCRTRKDLERRGHRLFLVLFGPLSCRELKGERESEREREDKTLTS